MKKYGPMSLHVRRLCMKIIKKLNFESALDAGCGEGSFLKSLKKRRPEAALSGADISREIVNSAAKTTRGVRLHAIDLATGFIEEKYDLVTAIEVIEHIGDDVQFLKNIHRMTNRYLLVCTLLGRMRDFESGMGHLRNYSEGELTGKLRRAGFGVLLIKKWGFPFYSPIYRNLCQWGPKGVSVGKFGVFKKTISMLLYLLFCLNDISGRGDLILVLARPL